MTTESTETKTAPAVKKDKQKVLGEVFDDQRVASFLKFKAPAGVNEDFHLIEKAYRGMNIENFITFLKFFKEQGRNVNATNPDGKTMLEIAAEHKHGADYQAALKEAGAE